MLACCLARRSPQTNTFDDFYDIEDVTLGEGSFGVVHQCVHKESEVRYAVKMINLGCSGTSKADFNREVEISSTLSHENVVRFQESFLEDGLGCIVYECLGEFLFHNICDREQYSESDVFLYMQQILSAVRYIHSQGVIHRDLKYAHILLATSSETDVIKLIDFGIAIKSDTERQPAVGIPMYKAPEMYIKSIQYGKPVDVWACGIIFCQLLLGYTPFDRSNKPKRRNTIFASSNVSVVPPAIQEARTKIVSLVEQYGISPWARDLLLAMLEYEHNERITADRAFDVVASSREGSSNQSLIGEVQDNIKSLCFDQSPYDLLS